jgi:hypothetical protein
MSTSDIIYYPAVAVIVVQKQFDNAFFSVSILRKIWQRIICNQLYCRVLKLFEILQGLSYNFRQHNEIAGDLILLCIYAT